MMGENRKKGFWLDPRAKLFLILMCVLASMVAPSLGYQFILVLLIALLGVLFGKWKYAVNAVCFYAVICVLTVWIMTEMTGTLRTMFVAFLGLFHRCLNQTRCSCMLHLSLKGYPLLLKLLSCHRQV